MSAYVLPPYAIAAPTHARRLQSSVALCRQEQALHRVARSACLAGRNAEAQRCYEIAMQSWGSARSFLLAALCYQRVGRIEDARATFSTGIRYNRDDAKLMQAWGLFESKHGELGRAVRLLKRAVTLDPSLHSVLRWRRFRGASMSLAAPSEVSGDQSTSDALPPLTEVQKPRIRYTVPQHARGWRGRPEAGEDSDSWYDDLGPRNGPPTNYWRQAMDERIYRTTFAAVDEIIDSAGAPWNDVTLRRLESRMSITKPLRNRKLLGRWAALVTNGQRVAASGTSADAYAVRSVVNFARAAGRQTFEHRYGVFDAHLDEKEPLIVGIAVAPSFDNWVTASVAATAMNDRASLPLSLPGGGAMHLGGVSLLSDYVLVTRDKDGALQDLYVRVDAEEDGADSGGVDAAPPPGVGLRSR